MKYYLPDHGETEADAREMGDGSGMFDHNSFTAEEAADMYQWIGGFESSYPLKIILVGGGYKSAWEVERECIPSFDATRVPVCLIED